MPRERIPLETHKLCNTRPQYVAKGESNVPGSLPRPAKFLSKDAKKKFRALVRQLADRRTVTAGDADLISLYCSLWERWHQSLAKILEEGSIRIYTRLGADGTEVQVEKENLHIKLAQSCERQMVTILRQLGLTPRDRDAVKEVATPKISIEDEDQIEQERELLKQLLAERAAQKVPEPALALEDIDENVVDTEGQSQ
jgi:P27 family predicted phage terminase small subunit